MFVALAWIRRHCVVPDGFRKGRPFKPYLYQTEYLGNFYRVRHDAVWVPENPVLAPAFVYRHGLLVGPQKLGKDPAMAAQICLEAVGPALFAGWATEGEAWVCAERGCQCGWVYHYRPGEPMGMRWPTPLIQVAAFSEKATDNTYRALVPMIEQGPLSRLIPKTGEEFIRLPNDGRIDTVTSEGRSRLGNPVTHVNAGELGIWDKPSGMDKTFDTMSRGVSGMGGRVSGTTNAWDPAQNSVAQTEYESAALGDIFCYYVDPGLTLSIRNKEERRALLRKVYPADVRRENGGHLDLDSIEPEIARLIAKGEQAQAARFFGNQLVAGAGKAFDLDTWKMRHLPGHAVPPKAAIVIGGDGSKTDDLTALIATEVATGHQWPLGIWDPADHGGKVPVAEVTDTIADAFSRYTVVLLYMDPPYWGDEIAAWQGRYGEKVVKDWATFRNGPMGWAVRNYSTALADGTLSHSGDERLTAAIGNAHRRTLLVRDAEGIQLFAIQKESQHSRLKVDPAVAAVLSWEARTDAIAGGLDKPRYAATSGRIYWDDDPD